MGWIGGAEKQTRIKSIDGAKIKTDLDAPNVGTDILYFALKDQVIHTLQAMLPSGSRPTDSALMLSAWPF